MSPEAMRKRVLEGDVRRTLLILSAPLILNQLVQVLYNLVDTFWLGRLGRAAISAPAVAWPVMMTAIFFASGFTAAGTALISQLVGARRYEEVDMVLGQLLFAELIIGVFFGAIGFIFPERVLTVLQVPQDVLPLAAEYMRILAVIFPITAAGFAFSTAMRAAGDTKTPTVLNISTLVLNAILDPLLIFGWFGVPPLGVTGAALATAVSNVVYSLALWIVFARGYHGITIRLRHVYPHVDVLKRVVRVGLPSAASSSLNGLSFAVIMAIVASFGTLATAAYGVGMRIINIVSGIVFGTSQAAGIMLGQALGARMFSRAKYALFETIKLNVTVTIGLAILAYVFAPQIVATFISDAQVVMEGTRFIRIFSFSVPFFAVFFPVMFGLRATGRTKISALLGILRLWLIRIPLTYVLGLTVGLAGVWWGLSLTNVISAVIAAYFLVNTRWLKPIV